MQNQGLLYIVATPIGNLQDITQRALAVLQGVDAIAAEDTRHSAHLLQHYGIKTPLLSLHAHNEHVRVKGILDKLQAGQSIALISDAGTPLISDPGALVVKAVIDAGITVIPIPGACAGITALSAAGLSTKQFIFEGFLLSQDKARREALKALSEESRTIILYEAPHRIEALLLAMQDIMGENRQIVLARELTKQFESFYRGSIKEIVQRFHAEAIPARGEMVVLIEGSPPKRQEENYTITLTPLLKTLLSALPLKQAVTLAVQITGGKKQMIYKAALALKDD